MVEKIWKDLWKDFDGHDRGCLHDTAINGYDDTLPHIDFNEGSNLEKLFYLLPEKDRHCASQHGMGDTVFRDNVFEYIGKIAPTLAEKLSKVETGSLQELRQKADNLRSEQRSLEAKATDAAAKHREAAKAVSEQARDAESELLAARADLIAENIDFLIEITPDCKENRACDQGVCTACILKEFKENEWGRENMDIDIDISLERRT